MIRTEALIFARAAALSGEARALRVAADLSLAEVADAVGRDKATISRWEHGKVRPRGDAAVRYGRLLAQLAASEDPVEVSA